MPIQIEFFGIPRHRTGVSTVRFEFDGESVRLAEVLDRLRVMFPRFASDCLDERGLQTTVLANVCGRRFLNDPEARLNSGDSLLLLSADGGG